MHRCANLWLDTGFVQLDSFDSVWGIWTFGPVFAGFLWSTGHPLIGRNYCAGLVGKDKEKSVSWKDFATVLEVDRGCEELDRRCL